MSLITDLKFYLNLRFIFLFTVQNQTTCFSISLAKSLFAHPGIAKGSKFITLATRRKKRDNYDKKSPSELLFSLFFVLFYATAERNPKTRCFCFLVSENPTFKDNLERARAGISSPGTSTLFKESGTTLGKLRQIWGRQGGGEEEPGGKERVDDEAGRREDSFISTSGSN